MSNSLKERILNAASELFYRHGIRATGVDAIVKAAGTTKMSLYHYFPSKKDLVLAHLQKSAENMRERILDGIVKRASGPKDRLLAVFEVFNELVKLDEFRGCPFINAAAEASADEEAFRQASAEFYQELREVLAGFAADALAQRPVELSQQLVLLLSGAIIAEQMQRESGAMAMASRAAKILIEQACMPLSKSAN